MSNTILTVLNKTIEYFKDKGIEEARLDAQLLLSECLKISRIDLYVQFERLLVIDELNSFRKMVWRRGLREPIQRILGHTHFRYGVFKTNNNCLIPRKETEILVDLTLEQIKMKSYPEVLEVGVGSGVILLSILKESSNIKIQGCDVDDFALELTAENAKMNSLEIEGKLVKSDLFSSFSENQKWDIIVSNPPYISEEEYNNLEPEIKNWDPRIALVGGKTGLECIELLLTQTYSHLKSKGVLLLETGFNQSSAIQSLGENLGFTNIMITQDYAKVNRFISLQKE